MEYFERLKAVREDLDLTQKDAANALNTNQQQIYRYETGINEMTVSKLKTLCLLYGVSADYVLGLPRGLNWPR